MTATRLDWIDAAPVAGRIAVLTLDLPGKSANLLFADADLETALRTSLSGCFSEMNRPHSRA